MEGEDLFVEGEDDAKTGEAVEATGEVLDEAELKVSIFTGKYGDFSLASVFCGLIVGVPNNSLITPFFGLLLIGGEAKTSTFFLALF